MRPAHLSALLICTLASAPADAGWRSGAWKDHQYLDCWTKTPSTITTAFSSYWEWQDGPKVGELFYVRASIGVVGNACKGGVDVLPEFVLPDGVFLAISPEAQVRCWYVNMDTGQATEAAGEACPQTPVPGTYGFAFQTDATATGLFPVAYGYVFEMWVPVLAKRPLSAAPLSTPIFGVGDTTFWTTPSVALFVRENPPSIVYPQIATTEITETSARVKGFVENHYAPGTVSIDLGQTDAFELGSLSGRLGDADAHVIEQPLTGLEPGTPYLWRLKFVADDGAMVTGEVQRFTTAGVRRYAINIATTDGGAVAAVPAGELQPEGQQLTVTATAAEGHRFVGWTVDGREVADGNPLTRVVSGPMQILARFEPAPQPPQSDGGTPPGTGSGATPGVDPPRPDPAEDTEEGGCAAAPAAPLSWLLAVGAVRLLTRRRTALI